MDQQEWMPEQAPTQIADMDLLITDLKRARDEYDEAKKKSAEAYHKLEEYEKKVVNALKSNNRTKFEAEGVGLVYISHKEVYETPKTIEQKYALFDYINKKYGPDALTTMLSVNHQTLNSWANKETEADPTLRIPGLNDPTSVETLNFRRK